MAVEWGHAGRLSSRTPFAVDDSITACVLRQTHEGMQLLADMRAAGFAPRENTCNFLLKEAAARGAFREAFATVRDMADGGIAPRLRSYAPILSGLLEQVGYASGPCEDAMTAWVQNGS